jgi:HK97 family phage major capsid protein
VTPESALRAIRDVAATMDVPADSRWLRLCRQVDPQRVLRNLLDERVVGADREASDELDRQFRRTEPNSATIPWETLLYRTAQTRADVAGTSTAGGYLIETLNAQSAAASLLALLVLGRLGVTPLNSKANLSLPKVTGSSTPYWITENGAVTEADLSFGQLVLSPHLCGGYTEISRLLLQQSSPDASNVVTVDLVRRLKRFIEAACFNGTGVAGQPHGIVGTGGVTSASGASATLSTMCTAVGAIGDALDPDTNCGWAANRSVALTLRQRMEVATYGSVPLWRGPATFGQLIDYPAAASSGVPSGDAIFGAWAFSVLADFAGGLMVSVNPFGGYGGSDAGNFKAGITGIRILAAFDFGIVWPAAFSVLTAVT